MAIDTQPISDAHDALFERVMQGLTKVEVSLVGETEDAPQTASLLERGFAGLRQGLTWQHDLVESFLARGRA